MPRQHHRTSNLVIRRQDATGLAGADARGLVAALWRALMAKFVSLQDAIADALRDGQSVALEGSTHLIPFAAGHEIIRQRRRDLRLIRMTPDIIYDQLIGAGCASKLVFSWGGNPGVGIAPPVS